MDNPRSLPVIHRLALHAFLSRCMRCNPCIVTGTNVHVRFRSAEAEVSSQRLLPDLDPLLLIQPKGVGFSYVEGRVELGEVPNDLVAAELGG